MSQFIKQMLVLSCKDSHAFSSVNQINKSLRTIYQSYSPANWQVRSLRISEKPNLKDSRALESYVTKNHPDCVVVLNQALHNLDIIKRISFITASNCQFVIHLTGDFLARPNLLANLDADLINRKVKWIVSCARFKKILEMWIKSGTIEIVNLPVSIHKPPPKSKSDFELIYGGRNLESKNIHRLVQLYPKMAKANGLGKVAIAGFKKNTSNSSIQYLGDLNQQAFCRQLSRSRFYISPSTYWMEFFGYSIAQSLLLDRPAIVSNWGGHQVFAKAPGITWIKVKKIKNQWTVTEKDIELGIKAAFKKAPLPPGRISRYAEKHFSIDSLYLKYWKIVEKRCHVFGGFSKSLHIDSNFFFKHGFLNPRTKSKFQKIMRS